MEDYQDNDPLAFERDLRALVPREANFELDSIANAPSVADEAAHEPSLVVGLPVIRKLVLAWSLGLAAGIGGTFLSLRMMGVSLQIDATTQVTTMGGVGEDPFKDRVVSVDGAPEDLKEANAKNFNRGVRDDLASMEPKPLFGHSALKAGASHSLAFHPSKSNGGLTPLSLVAHQPSAAPSSSILQKGGANSEQEVEISGNTIFEKPSVIRNAVPQTQRDLLRSMLGSFTSI